MQLLGVLFLLLTVMPTFANEGKDYKLKLRSRVFGNTRYIRVWTPPGYRDKANQARHYPVFYFTDGSASFSKDAWNAPGVMAKMIEKGDAEPWIIVGIDNGGNTRETTHPAINRAEEYLPYEDQNWVEHPSPTPKGQKFPQFLFEEVMPLIERKYRVKTGRASTGLAGASFGGVIALYTGLKHADKIGYLIVESPSLRVGREQLFRDLETVETWPLAIYVGAGTEEGGSEDRLKKKYLDRVQRYFAALQQEADDCRLHLEITEGGQHWFGHWQYRLPVALHFTIGK